MEKAMALLSKGKEFVANLPLAEIMEGASTISGLLTSKKSRRM
jgi:hypothetical protein